MMLKKYCIALFSLSLLAIAGCDNDILGEQEDVVIIPTHGYIHFTPQNPTRGELISDMKRNFGVMGYKWEYNNVNDVWNTVKVMAKPNVFHAQKVTYNAESTLHTYDARPSGYPTALVPWKVGSKYTFFGYYPHESESNGISVSDKTTEGTPYLTYTLPTAPAKMQDVMTASLYNTDYKSAREVQLNFKHRLAAMDLQMINTNAQLGGIDVYVKLTDLRVKLTSMQYKQAKIWMDESMSMERTANSEQVDYLLSQSITIAPSGGASGTLNIVTSGTPLILIPQETSLNGIITFDLSYVNSNGENMEINDAKVNVGTHTYNFKIPAGLVAGRRHLMQLTFTRDAVTIQIVPPSEWTDNNVEIEFD